MAILYNTADALISIPKSDQFSACIQEGMVCGMIPIVGNLEVYRQYLVDDKNAFFVDPENPKEIAQKIIYGVEHPELREKLYEINRKIIGEKEDWDKNTKKMEDLYLSLTQESKEIRR
jgi:glycosyltransferase involved in cell wall biosynthesis